MIRSIAVARLYHMMNRYLLRWKTTDEAAKRDIRSWWRASGDGQRLRTETGRPGRVDAGRLYLGRSLHQTSCKGEQ